jgi:hypothetical protein
MFNVHLSFAVALRAFFLEMCAEGASVADR